MRSIRLTTACFKLERVGLSNIVLVLMLVGCQNADFASYSSDSEFRLIASDGPHLPQRTLVREQAPATDRIRVYLGGDGVPWRDNRPSDSPTGKQQLGFQMFLADPAAHAYLGRPCYQVDTESYPECTSDLWTSHRYGERVVQVMMQALDDLRRDTGAQSAELIGYSGGGTLAVLIAARDPQVDRVLTIAAVLDPVAWTRFHRLLPLDGSLSPLTASRIDTVDESHLLGAADKVVPPDLARAYAAKHPGAKLSVVESFDHRCCWLREWPELLTKFMPEWSTD